MIGCRNMIGTGAIIELGKCEITPPSHLTNTQEHSIGSFLVEKYHWIRYEYPTNEYDKKKRFDAADHDFYYGTGLPVFRYQIQQEQDKRTLRYQMVNKNYILQALSDRELKKTYDGPKDHLRTSNSPTLGLGIDFTRGEFEVSGVSVHCYKKKEVVDFYESLTGDIDLDVHICMLDDTNVDDLTPVSPENPASRNVK